MLIIRHQLLFFELEVLQGQSIHKCFTPERMVKYFGLLPGSYCLANSSGYMDNETWAQVVEIIAPAIHLIK
eukprot:453249-Ditylum_brightwellii.AAC.1